ncbi:MAG: sigma 54-interacting transcriptional regulator [Desulfobacteraceae bacterium]|jgi:DNA-binding NtrC family response regulator
MPVDQQVKLLRVLEDNRIMSVGSNHDKYIDVRVIAATNSDLAQKMAQGIFRNDLYYRLATFTIAIPPLRERKEDIPTLAQHFMEFFSSKMGISVPKINIETMSILLSHHFRGNVRELKNIIEHALILSNQSEILPEHLPFLQQDYPLYQAGDGKETLPREPIVNRSFGEHAPPFNYISLPPDQVEVLLVRGALAEMENDIEAAADLLNVNPVYIEKITQRMNKRNILKNRISDEDKIRQYVYQHGSINNSECRELLHTDLHRASYLLKKMYKEGSLNREKGGRWARYIRKDSIGNSLRINY